VKKKSLSEFCSFIQRELEDFEMSMQEAKFTAHRTNAAWMKLLQDYLDIDFAKENVNDDLEDDA
jgi:hypothetical protein